jgi:flagellar biosynthesis protein FlhB
MPIDAEKINALRTAFTVAIIIVIMSGVAFIVYQQASNLPGTSVIQTPLNNLAGNATQAMSIYYQMLGLLIIVGVIGAVMDIFATRFGGGG